MREWVRIVVQDNEGHEVAVWQVPYTGDKALDKVIAVLQAVVRPLGGVSE